MSLPTPYYHDDDAGIVIYNADCRDILPLLPKVDLVLTDIPFNVNLNYASYNDKLTDVQYAGIVEEWFLCFKKCSNAYIVKSPTKTMPIVLPIFANILGYVWTVIQYSPNATTHGPFNLSLYTQYLIGGIIPKRPNCDYFINTKQSEKTIHPASMPIYPIKRLLGWFSNDYNSIVDPFMGSGTTLVAAKQLHRKAIGIEIEEKYCEIAVKRLGQGVLPI